MEKPKNAVEALQNDELYKLLAAGRATPEDQQFAAKWIATLSAFLHDKAKAIAESIIADLEGRTGLRHAWDGIDDEMQDEIRKAWTEIVFERIVEV